MVVRLCPWMDRQIFAPRQFLLGNRSCVALISYIIHVTMHCPTTVHPWTYAISALPPSVVVVFRKEPGMAVRLCPWMVGQISAPRQLLLHCPTTVHPWTYAISALPPSVVVVFCKEPGMAVRLCPWMDGQISAPRQPLLDNRSCVVLLPSIHGHMRCPNKLHLTSMDGGNATGL